MPLLAGRYMPTPMALAIAYSHPCPLTELDARRALRVLAYLNIRSWRAA